MAEHNKKDLSDFKKYLKDEVVHGIQQTINENTQNIENNTNAITQNTQDIQNSVTSISNLITSFNGMQTDVSNIQDQVLVLYDKLNKTFTVCRTIEVRQTDQHPFLDTLLSVWFLTLQVLFSCVPASLVQAYGRVLKDRVPRVLQKQSAVYEPSSHLSS